MSFLFLIIVLQYLFEAANEERKFKFSWYTGIFALFVIYTILSDIFLAHKPINFRYFYGNAYIGCLLVLIAADNYTNTSRSIIKNLIRIFEVIIFISLVVIIIQEVFDQFFFVFTERISNDTFLVDVIEKRLPSIYSWAGYLDSGFVFVPFLSLIIGNRIAEGQKNLSFYYFIGATVVFLTRSRWIMLNFLVLFLMLISKKRFKKNKLYLNILVISGILIVSFSFLSWLDVPVQKIISDRIFEQSYGGFGKGSTASRLAGTEVFLKLFPENMIFGRGMLHAFGGQSKDVKLITALAGESSQIHLGYLSLFYYYGLIGGGLFIIFIVLLMKKLFKDAKIIDNWGPFYGFLGFVLANLTLVSLGFFNAGLILCLFMNKMYLDIKKKSMQIGTV